MAVTPLLKREVVFAVFTCILAEVLTLSVIEDYSDGNIDRHKRQEERWSWGYVDYPEIVSPRTNNYSSTETPEVCKPYDPPLPDFTAPGRRISEIKCYEYIWDINLREEQERRSSECFKLKIQDLEDNVRPVFAIGGRDTFTGEFPHMGAIGWQAVVGSWIFKCGGSLISNKFMLTASHCTSISLRDTSVADPIPKIVRLGDKNILDTMETNVYKIPEDRKIIKIITHPQYKPPKKYFDIALMELDREVTFNERIQPACLWTKFDTSSLGREVTATGWGVVEAKSTNISPELQVVNIDMIDTEQCQHLLQPSCNRLWCGVDEHQLCAGKLSGGVDVCQGDSGGPLQSQIKLPVTSQGKIYYIIGVTSFGIGCALPGLPGVYTRVASFIDWIEGNVWLK